MINGMMHEHISQFMSQHRLPKGLRLFVVRGDGLLVWDGKPDNQSQALAALCSGVWEASKAMAKAAGQDDVKDFRFVFDSTDHGVLIFPVDGDGQGFHLAAIYEGCVNPALLKRQVHGLGGKLAQHVRQLPKQTRVFNQPQREGYLFSDISDDEMNRLFGI
jgi:hypothetical protein